MDRGVSRGRSESGGVDSQPARRGSAESSVEAPSAEEIAENQNLGETRYAQRGSSEATLPAPRIDRLHEEVGNRSLLEALSAPDTSSDGFASVVRLGVINDIAGIPPSADGSGEALRRAMRDAGIEAGHPSLVSLRASGGRPLEPGTLERMQRVFGHDFSHVRVHTDSLAAQQAEALAANAFALGAHVFFGSGRYAPGTPEGDRLLAHELTHVVQHDAGQLPSGGGVSDPNDRAEVEAYGNEDRILRALSSATASPGDGGDEVLSWVRRFAAQLGLAAESIDVHADRAGAARARAVGSRGLMEDGAIFLDPTRFDPRSPDGRGLIAHEVFHLAQQSLAPAEDPRAGLLAEAEAQRAAQRAAAGQALLPAEFGLPSGHVAAEDGGAGPLTGMLESFKNATTGRGEALPNAPANVNANPDKSAAEDRAAKLEMYRDGVDGIADQIGDLDAFEELCDAVSDGSEAASRTAIQRLKRTKPFQDLADRWQAAVDGGPDRAAMEREFNAQFEGRGFWGSTEKAFTKVKAAAKAEAKRNAEIEAKKKQAEAQKKRQEGQSKQDAKELPDGQAGKASGAGSALGKATASLSELLNATVSEKAPDLPSILAMQSISDEAVDDIGKTSARRDGLIEEMESGGQGSRGDDMLAGLMKGPGAFTESFSKGLVLGLSAMALDRMIGGASGGAVGGKNFPVAGSVFNLWMNPPTSEKYWEKQGKSYSEGWDKFKSTFDWSGLEHCKDPMDYVGVFCAKLADLVEGLYKWLDAINTLLGTIAAVMTCGGLAFIILGGILCLCGIPVGFALCQAGYWLMNVGMRIENVCSWLSPIILGFAAMALLLRAIATATVPAEMYAEQLAAYEGTVTEFFTKAGETTADATTSGVDKATTKNPDSAPGSSGDGSKDHETSVQKGRDDVNNVKKEAKSREKPFKDQSKEIEAKGGKNQKGGKKKSETEKNKNESKGSSKKKESKKDGDDAPTRQDNAPAQPGRLKRFVDGFTASLSGTVGSMFAYRKGFQGLRVSFKELQRTFTDPNGAVRESMGPVRSRYEELVQQTQKQLSEVEGKVDSLRGRVDDLTAKLDGGELSPGDKSKLEKDLSNAKTEIGALQKDVDNLRAEVLSTQKKIEFFSRGDPEQAQRDEQSLADAQQLSKDIQQKQQDHDAAVNEKTAMDDQIRDAEQAVKDAEAMPKGKDRTRSINRARKQLNTLNKQRQGASDKVDQLKAEKESLESQMTQEKRDRVEGANQLESTRESTRATGIAVLNDWLIDPFMRLAQAFEKAQHGTSKIKEYQQATNEKAEAKDATSSDIQEASVFGAMGESVTTNLKELMGLSKETMEELGNRRQQLEILAEMEPPEDIASLSDHRRKAIDAANRYGRLHQYAYELFLAEQLVGKQVQDTEKLSTEAAPLVTKSEDMRGPIDKSKGDEQARKGKLASLNETSPKSEGGLGSMLTEAMNKFGSFAEYFSQTPSTGGADGNQISEGTTEAGKTTKDGKRESVASSEEQTQLLDASLEAQRSQKARLETARSSLDSKAADQRNDKASIQLRKANALMMRDEAAREAESEATQFTEKYYSLKDWAVRYEEGVAKLNASKGS